MAIGVFPDVPSFRGWDGSKYVYWTSADAQPGGVSDIVSLPLQGVSGSINPYNISNMLFWFRADYGVENNSSKIVNKWKDLSGNGYHVGNTSDGPLFTTSSLLNSRPSVLFSGQGQNGLTCSHQDALSPRALTVFVMGTMGSAEVPTWSTYYTFVSKTDSGGWSDGWSIGSRDASNGLAFWFNSWNNYVQKSDYANFPTVVLATGRAGTGDNLIFRSNRYDVNKTISGSYTPSTSGFFMIGGAVGSYPCAGHVAEVIGYSRALTDREMHQVEHYLTAKYGLGNQ